MKSTIVIPNYNGIKYIENCLDSVFENIPCKVIVVDNASEDGSCELIAEKYGERVLLLKNRRNTGFCRAVNKGIREADTPYVILLNNDTVIDKNFVFELEKIMDSDENIFSSGAKMISMHDHSMIDDAGDYYCALGWAFARGKGKSPVKYDSECDTFSACAGAAIYRRELFEKIGLFDETHFAYLEDVDIGYRARIKGFRNVFAPKAIVYHAGSASSGSRYNKFKTRLTSRNSVYIIHKNMPLAQQFLNLPLLIIGFMIKVLFFCRKGLGVEYIKGLMNGVRLSCSDEGRKKRVLFVKENMMHYVKIQLELWRNLFLLSFVLVIFIVTGCSSRELQPASADVATQSGLQKLFTISELHNGDAKFMNEKIFTGVNGVLNVIDFDGKIVKGFDDIKVNWLDVVEEENVILYGNFDHQIGVLRLDENRI